MDSSVFVVGAPRSATRYAAAVLATAPGVHAVHENNPSPVLEIKEAYHGRQSFMPIAESRLQLARKCGEKGLRYVESNHMLSLCIVHLKWYMGGAKFLWLVRDPREFVQSGCNREWYSPRDVEVQGKWAQGRLMPRPTDPFRDNWKGRPRIAKLAWLWRTFNAEILAQVMLLNRNDWNVLFVGDFRWKKQFAWLGLGYDEKAVAGVKPVNVTPSVEKKFGKYVSWSKEDKIRVDTIAMPLYKNLKMCLG